VTLAWTLNALSGWKHRVVMRPADKARSSNILYGISHCDSCQVAPLTSPTGEGHDNSENYVPPVVPRIAKFAFSDGERIMIRGEIWVDRPGAATARVEIHCTDRVTAVHRLQLPIADRPEPFALVRMLADRLEMVSKIREFSCATSKGEEGQRC